MGIDRTTHQSTAISGCGRLTIRVLTYGLLTLIYSLCIMISNVHAEKLRLQTYMVKDRQMGNIPAFRMVGPADGRLNGGLTWNANLANLVTADVSLLSNDGAAGFYVHPSPMYISGQIQYQWPQGQIYLGMIVVPMPNSPAAFLQQFVLPQRRPNAQNLRLVDQQDMPEWAARIAAINEQPGGTSQGFGTRARFAYTENGRKWEEDFYCVVVVFRSAISPQNAIWLADRNLSVRAQAGRLDALQSMASVFVNSFKVERQWYGRFTQIQQQWIAAQNRGIANAGALSRTISQVNDHFDRTFTSAWEARQKAQDRASREFSEYIRGSENYRDPVNDTQVELPGGYDRAWANASGEYVLSNEAGFDPNRHSNVDWVAIEAVR